MQPDTWRTAQQLAGISVPPRVLPTNGNGVNRNGKDNGNEVRPQQYDFPLTDAGNAEAFAETFGDRVRWDKRRRRWLIWKKHRWHQDLDGEVERLALECVRARQRIAVEINDDDKRKRALKWTIESESLYRRSALLKTASDLLPIVDIGDKWDSEDWILGCENGVIDLRAGTLRDGKPNDRITMTSNNSFDANAECPRWVQFLEEIFEEADLIQFVQRAVGYSLTGDTSEQILFLCFGTGANGKSVFLDTLLYVMGDYANNTPFSTFELRERDSATNDVAALVGKRLVTSSETREFAQLNEARVKAITGGDPVTARFLHQEFFTFYPRFKVWLAANHKPKVSDDSYGFWRRMRLIPFTKTFGPDKADPNLRNALREEARGILTWAVLGALAWQSEGLKPPPSVSDATELYREESDPLAGFLNDRCIQNENAKVQAADLLAAYNSWAKNSGEPELKQTALGRRMGARGFEKKQERDAYGTMKWHYVGIGLAQ